MVKRTGLAVVVALALAGCGGGDIPSEVPGADPSAAAERDADLWAQNVFGIYGLNAVETCLAGFHAEFQAINSGAANYRAELAEYLCGCARGQSPAPCPKP
jgi:hypothetical protein